jgi:hypothetical protein
MLARLRDGGEFAIIHAKNFTALDDDDLSVILCDHIILVGQVKLELSAKTGFAHDISLVYVATTEWPRFYRISYAVAVVNLLLDLFEVGFYSPL